MKKLTKKQIEANLRNKIAKSNNEKYDFLQERFNNVSKQLYDARKRIIEAESCKAKLEEKIRQYEDWIDRLQEFCNMNEEDRKISIEAMIAEQNFKNYIAESSFLKIFQKFLIQ